MCNPLLAAFAFAGQSLMSSIEQNQQIAAANEAQRQAFEANEAQAKSAFFGVTASMGVRLQQSAQAHAQKLNALATRAMQASSTATVQAKGQTGRSAQALIGEAYAAEGRAAAAIAHQKKFEIGSYYSKASGQQRAYQARVLGAWKPEMPEMGMGMMMLKAGIAGFQGYLMGKTAFGDTMVTPGVAAGAQVPPTTLAAGAAPKLATTAVPGTFLDPITGLPPGVAPATWWGNTGSMLQL